MIDPALYPGFVAAVVVLMLIPGPNVALIVANSVAHGPRYGLLTVAGTSAAMVMQLGLTALGMTALLGGLGMWLGWLRWIGVVYLIGLGIAHWRAPAAGPAARAGPRPGRGIWLRAWFVSMTNPKTLFFYGALFPQFIAAHRPVGPQIVVLAATFLLLAVAIDSGWALAAGRARGVLAAHGRWRNRLTGSVLIGAGAALALARSR